VERLYEIRSEVISRVTHEFRTPLTGIRATVELMRAGKQSPAHLDILLGSVNRLEELINSLLALGRDRLEDIGDATSAYDPAAVAQESITRYTSHARKRDIGFLFTQDSAEQLPSPRISPDNFIFVLDALVDNAVKFSPNGGRIEISLATGDGVPVPEREGLVLPDWRASTRALIDSCRGGVRGVELSDSIVSLIESQEENEEAPRGARAYLVVRVTDAGIGIPEDEIAAISEPFQQASNSPDLGVKGRGLGLALVQKIVSACGGNVYCRSDDGDGTTMTLFLPAD
jgi:two-component system phosphate regulon sensor histidine kinase PhoR